MNEAPEKIDFGEEIDASDSFASKWMHQTEGMGRKEARDDLVTLLRLMLMVGLYHGARDATDAYRAGLKHLRMQAQTSKERKVLGRVQELIRESWKEIDAKTDRAFKLNPNQPAPEGWSQQTEDEKGEEDEAAAEEGEQQGSAAPAGGGEEGEILRDDSGGTEQRPEVG